MSHSHKMSKLLYLLSLNVLDAIFNNYSIPDVITSLSVYSSNTDGLSQVLQFKLLVFSDVKMPRTKSGNGNRVVKKNTLHHSSFSYHLVHTIRILMLELHNEDWHVP